MMSQKLDCTCIKSATLKGQPWNKVEENTFEKGVSYKFRYVWGPDDWNGCDLSTYDINDIQLMPNIFEEHFIIEPIDEYRERKINELNII